MLPFVMVIFRTDDSAKPVSAKQYPEPIPAPEEPLAETLPPKMIIVLAVELPFIVAKAEPIPVCPDARMEPFTIFRRLHDPERPQPIPAEFSPPKAERKPFGVERIEIFDQSSHS
jgi:hypothetical protein